MQTPVFLILFFAPVYVPLSLLQGWIHSVAVANPDHPADRGRAQPARREPRARRRRLPGRVRADRRLRGLGAPEPAPRGAGGMSQRVWSIGMGAAALGFAALGIAAFAPADGAPQLIELLTGAEARVTNPGGRKAVVCVNGGTGREVPGTWAPTLECSSTGSRPQFPELSFVEVRYRIKSWKRLTWCIDDCRAAITLAAGEGAEEIALLGFSMGGAVAIAAADHPLVTTVIGARPVDPGPARRGRARRPPRRDRPRRPRPLAARHPRRQPEELAARLRPDARARDRRHAHDHPPCACTGRRCARAAAVSSRFRAPAGGSSSSARSSPGSATGSLEERVRDHAVAGPTTASFDSARELPPMPSRVHEFESRQMLEDLPGIAENQTANLPGFFCCRHRKTVTGTTQPVNTSITRRLLFYLSLYALLHHFWRWCHIQKYQRGDRLLTLAEGLPRDSGLLGDPPRDRSIIIPTDSERSHRR